MSCFKNGEGFIQKLFKIVVKPVKTAKSGRSKENMKKKSFKFAVVWKEFRANNANLIQGGSSIKEPFIKDVSIFLTIF